MEMGIKKRHSSPYHQNGERRHGYTAPYLINMNFYDQFVYNPTSEEKKNKHFASFYFVSIAFLHLFYVLFVVFWWKKTYAHENAEK